MAEDLDYERTLVQLPQCFVFKIPPRSAEGHRASNWPQQPTWSGKLKIVAKGPLAVIVLVSENGQTFAMCPVRDDSYVERTIDSGRYFVLKIENSQGKHAYVGIAFNDRNHAFDFNVALSEHKNQQEREEKARKAFEEMQSAHAGQDLHIKSGEKIQIKIGSATKKPAAASSGTSSGPFVLAPPGSKPSGGLFSPPPAFGAAPQSPQPAANVFSSFADPFSSPAGSSDPFATSSAAPVASADPFGSSWGSDPWATSSAAAPASNAFGSTDPFGFPASSPAPAAANNNSFSSFSSPAKPASGSGGFNLLDL